MNSVKYINPEGAEVAVPEADAPWFDEQGWTRSEEAGNSGSKYADMSAAELKELASQRGIEGVTKKKDIITALEAQDAEETNTTNE